MKEIAVCDNIIGGKSSPKRYNLLALAVLEAS